MFVSKRFFLLLFVVIACSKEPQGWQSTTIPTPAQHQSDVLWKVVFSSTDTAWIVGGQQYDRSAMLRSTDGGNTWQTQTAESGKVLFDLDWVDAQHGIAASYDCKMLQTDNGGGTWQVYQGGTMGIPWLPMRSVSFASDSVGVAVGGAGYGTGVVLRTTNGGSTWQQTQAFDSELREVQFVDATTAFAVGYGVVYKTSDGGLSWWELDVLGDFFVALHFVTPQLGYVVGNQGSIFKTLDGGYSWQRLRNGNAVLNPRHHFTDVLFTDPQTGYLLANQQLWHTTNGGHDFERYPLPCSTANSIALSPDGTYALVVGNDGCVCRIDWAN